MKIEEETERTGDSDSAGKCRRRDEIAESSPISSFSKKMKIQIESNLPQDHRLSAALSPDKTVSPATPSDSGGFNDGDHCSSSIESSLLPGDSLTSVDPEAKSFETEGSTCIDNKFSRESNPSTGDTDMDSQAAAAAAAAEGDKSCGSSLPAKKMPNQEEIDRFFKEAEEKEQKRFADKYNYDVVKDVPLEGRYQWVILKP